MKTENGNKYVATLNNTVLASPRGLNCYYLKIIIKKMVALLIPEVLRPYMGGKERIEVKR